MLTLYGSSQGRPSRSLIALEELGLAYKQVPLKPWDSPADAATLAALNPNARVPVLDDDGLVVWESMAINLYLGDRYGGPLWPAEAHGRARLYQWSLWSQTSVDVMARHRARFSDDPEIKARGRSRAPRRPHHPRRSPHRPPLPAGRGLHARRPQRRRDAGRALGKRPHRRRP